MTDAKDKPLFAVLEDSEFLKWMSKRFRRSTPPTPHPLDEVVSVYTETPISTELERDDSGKD